MVDRERVADLIAAAERYISDVERFRDAVGRDAFLAQRGEQYRIEYPLQQAIQCCTDIAAHLLAGGPSARPATLAGLFTALPGLGIIDDGLALRLAAMARFRNLLVHEYADVDPERVYEIITNDLSDLRDFLAAAAAA